MTPDPDEDAVTFKELCGCFHAALSLGPCVLLLDGVNDLGGAIGLSPQEVWVKHLTLNFLCFLFLLHHTSC